MKTPELPSNNEFIKRKGTGEMVAKFEEQFVGETLFNAADYLAEVQGVELEDLFNLRRPLNVSINRPTSSGRIEYEFTVVAEDEQDVPDSPAFQYVLSKSDTELIPLVDLTDEEQAQLRELIAADEEPDEEALFLLDLARDEQQGVMCSKEYLSYYQGYQQALALTKSVETHYYIGSAKVASIGFSLGEEEPIPTDDTASLLLASSAMDLSVIEFDDMHTLNEILYYLNLPGGVIATEVTGDYLDDERVVRY